jgi:hypothetical protein
MQKQIFELINRNYQEIRNNNEYYLKIQLGKYESVNIFEDILYQDENDFYNFLNNYKKIVNIEYYQYQYENQYYQKLRNFKSNSFIDSLIDFEIMKSQSQTQTYQNDYRFSIHHKKNINMFSQHMNYHNIIFVKEKIWQITDECQFIIYEINKKTQNKNFVQFHFRINIPLSEQSLTKIIKEIEKFNSYFKHKYDKKHKFHSLDSVLESEQPHLELIQDRQP